MSKDKQMLVRLVAATSIKGGDTILKPISIIYPGERGREVDTVEYKVLYASDVDIIAYSMGSRQAFPIYNDQRQEQVYILKIK